MSQGWPSRKASLQIDYEDGKLLSMYEAKGQLPPSHHLNLLLLGIPQSAIYIYHSLRGRRGVAISELGICCSYGEEALTIASYSSGLIQSSRCSESARQTVQQGFWQQGHAIAT